MADTPKFESSTLDLISEKYENMGKPKQAPIVEKKAAPVKRNRVITESTERLVVDKPVLGSRFNQVMENFMSGKSTEALEEDCGCDKGKKKSKRSKKMYREMDETGQEYEDDYYEDEMIEIPRSVVEEIASYLENIGSKDFSDDLEELEEGFQNNPQYDGKPRVQDKLLKSQPNATTNQKQASKVSGVCGKARHINSSYSDYDGKPRILAMALKGAMYQHGSQYQKSGKASHVGKGIVGE